MIVAVTSFSCRVKGCKEIWCIVNDGSFDDVMIGIEIVPELARDAHEIKAHSDEQYEEMYYEYNR